MIGSFGRVPTNYHRPAIGSAGYFAAGAALAKPEPALSGLLTGLKMALFNLSPLSGKQRPMSETR